MTADLKLPRLGREWLLAGHLIDRAGMPHLISELGREGMAEVAIEEWMGASPVYTRRIREALGITGDGVADIFKAMQFDIGAPHQFMDFRYVVHDHDHGEFWLASCGALLDVEPMGEDYVLSMCHHIEDPTFDATAIATNPRARMRPVHRPPANDVDRETRHEHCRWTVTIEHDAEPLPTPGAATRVAASRANAVEVAPGDDYAGDLDPELRLERFSDETLRRLLDEIALQGHLLAHSFMLAVADRMTHDDAARLGRRQLAGVAGLVSRRLARHLGTADVATVLAVHPALHPRTYVDADVTSDTITIRGDCDELSWPAIIDTKAVAAMVHGIDPTMAVEQVGERAWTWAAGAEPAPEDGDVLLASFSTGAEFILR